MTILNLDKKEFVIYNIYLQGKILIYSAQKAQNILLLAKKVLIL